MFCADSSIICRAHGHLCSLTRSATQAVAAIAAVAAVAAPTLTQATQPG